MKPFREYDKARRAVSYKRLPVGAYVAEIKKMYPAKWIDGKATDVTGKGMDEDFYVILFDIAEGQYKGYFTDNYRDQDEPRRWRGEAWLYRPKDDGTEQDDNTGKRFARFVTALEDSNEGYLWKFETAESDVRGKRIGVLMQEEEYRKGSGDIGTAVKCKGFCSLAEIADGSYWMPRKRTVKRDEQEKPADSFFPEGDLSEDVLPFD